MATLLFIGFIVYLYCPFLLFKTFADLGVDLGRKRDSTKVEEFFAAALPSALLNCFAFLILLALRAAGVGAPGIDWRVVSSILEGDAFPALSRHLAAGIDWEMSYLGILIGVSLLNGLIYGQVERRLILGAAVRPSLQIPWRIARAIRNIWDPLMADQLVPMTAAVLQEPYVFVRLKDGRLFYGKLWFYTKNSANETQTIELIEAQRFSRDSIDACIRSMKSPLRRLHGSLAINWSEVVDINFAEPFVMAGHRRRYARRLAAARSASRAEKKPASA